jgi:type II restriction enzyme
MDKKMYSEQAIEAVLSGKMAFCKFLSANDTGLTGGHQYGIYVPKTSISILFPEPGIRGENKKKDVKIKWQNDFFTDSVFTYYGTSTRNEYRITRFGRGFELLHVEHTGDLFVFVKLDEEDYSAFVLTLEDDINAFLDYFGLSPADTGSIIGAVLEPENEKKREMDVFIHSLEGNFPQASVMSETARKIYDAVYDHIENVTQKPDKELLGWIAMEYELFQRIEEIQFGEQIRNGFPSMQQFIDVANSILNRRKSRAGKSLENHLASVFDGNQVQYEAQIRSEGNKKPDFIFPGSTAYHDATFNAENLVFLGAKTTCKDRWRQILNEANRIPVKHLFTLQQGISPQQLDEMRIENVILVVPQPYITTYPKEYQKSLFTLKKFIEFVKEKTE